MEAKRRIRRAFYWIDIKMAWLLHFPKPVDWEEFDRKLKEAMEEDARRYKAALEEAYKAGQKYALSKEGHEAISYLEGHQSGEKQGIDKGRKEEAKNIIACIKDAKRVHPDWTIKDIIELLLFREETRIAMSNRGSKNGDYETD